MKFFNRFDIEFKLLNNWNYHFELDFFFNNINGMPPGGHIYNCLSMTLMFTLHLTLLGVDTLK